MAKFTPMRNGFIAVTFKPSKVMTADMRSIPRYQCWFDWDKKHWVLDPEVAVLVQASIKQHMDQDVPIPQVSPIPTKKAVVQCDYIGSVRTRQGERSATGSIVVRGEDRWGLVFPEDVLLSWFGDEVELSKAAKGPYDQLELHPTCTDDQIRKAYRRMARQHHPDVSNSQDAKRRFEAIQEAYNILNDPDKRARYDGNRALLASQAKKNRVQEDVFYRPPRTNGMIYGLMRASANPDMRVVVEIHDWKSITNGFGQRLYSQWDSKTKTITKEWR